MFERYSERARRSIFFARREAGVFGSSTIESEHLLLGLMHDGRALLQRMANANLDGLRKDIEAIAPPKNADVPTSADLPISDPLKRVLGLAAEEAETLNHPHIDTEHLLLGLLREPTSFVSDLLRKYGIDRSKIREGFETGERLL
jgi:ATP-dependent Clp protease ATP-binding subunit ClpC